MATNSKTAQRRSSKQTMNADTHKVEQTHASASARPSKSSTGRTERRRKASVGGFRDILTVHPKDPNFFNEYVVHWFLDKDENGQRLFRAYNNDWDFVHADEVHIGESFVYNSEDEGSIVRRPAGHGEWLYLMKKRVEWAHADELELQRALDKKDRYINRQRDTEEDDGQYGSVNTNFELVDERNR